jgi:hypothetical protein
VRFVTLDVTLQGESSNAPWVFDTLARKRFRLTPPFPNCRFGNVGGGVVLWFCPSLTRPLISDLATGGAREPAGWAAVEAMERPPPPDYYNCSAYGIGRYWLQGECRGFGGGGGDPFYLNHRTGRLMTHNAGGFNAYDPRINLDYQGLVTPRCVPLRHSWLHFSLPPVHLAGAALEKRRVLRVRVRRDPVATLWRAARRRCEPLRTVEQLCRRPARQPLCHLGGRQSSLRLPAARSSPRAGGARAGGIAHLGSSGQRGAYLRPRLRAVARRPLRRALRTAARRTALPGQQPNRYRSHEEHNRRAESSLPRSRRAAGVGRLPSPQAGVRSAACAAGSQRSRYSPVCSPVLLWEPAGGVAPPAQLAAVRAARVELAARPMPRPARDRVPGGRVRQTVEARLSGVQPLLQMAHRGPVAARMLGPGAPNW